MQTVGVVARFQSAPRENHVQQVKRIFRYLKRTLDLGLWYPRGKYFSSTSYSNSNWAKCVGDRKRTNGCAYSLGNCLVSWLSKKWSSISLSTTEVEYVPTTTCCTQVIWMKRTLQDMHVFFKDLIPIL